MGMAVIAFASQKGGVGKSRARPACPSGGYSSSARRAAVIIASVGFRRTTL